MTRSKPKAFGVKVTLSYSGKDFGLPSRSPAKVGVPANLLILGTMNTADRSIALLDVALRWQLWRDALCRGRREIGHDGAWPSKRMSIPLGTLLTALNRKLEAYLDRDHQIGHSYFMGLNDVAELRFAWEHKVMPCSQEYFYGDGEKLRGVGGTILLPSQTFHSTAKATRAPFIG